MEQTAENDDDGSLCSVSTAVQIRASTGGPTWMMKTIMGFFGSYVDGFAPSRMPPCGVALTVLLGVAAVVANFVTTSVTVAVAMTGRALCSILQG
jgi:hypothetical protein